MHAKTFNEYIGHFYDDHACTAGLICSQTDTCHDVIKEENLFSRSILVPIKLNVDESAQELMRVVKGERKYVATLINSHLHRSLALKHIFRAVRSFVSQKFYSKNNDRKLRVNHYDFVALHSMWMWI